MMIRKLTAEADLVTFDEFCVLVPEDRKADLIDGVIYMAAADSRRANRLTNFVTNLLSCYLEARDLEGEVYSNRFAFQISEIRAPEPDVAYVTPERVQLIEENYMIGGPDIAIEIVARESRRRDYGEKRALYEEAGVTEYWIIDPLEHRCEFLRLKDDRYELVPLEDNRIFRSTVVPGLWIDVEWLLARKLPKVSACLQEILL